MKRLITLAFVTMLALSLSACAPLKGGETTHVKCPACGYEFEAPASPGN